MNINTTINLDDILNSNEEASSEETIEILKESIAETVKSIEENTPLPDFDAIVTEWSYRCDKGYPDMKSKSDMIKLQEILDEMGIKSPFKRVQLTELDKPKKKSVVKKVVKKVITKRPTVDDSEGYGPGIPIDKKDTTTIKAFKTKLSKIEWENKANVNDQILKIFLKLDKKAQENCVKLFQTSTLDQYTADSGTWTYWKNFFDIKLDGMGRGEAMSVMAIAGASSGGTKQKDLIITNEGTWEIKEKPDSIRLAKSGAVGKFVYANEIRKFYELLTDIKLNDQGNDNKLKTNIKALIGNENEAEAIFNILINNFRGDEYSKTKNKDDDDEPADESINEGNFFERISNGGELPSGVIELHYKGFQALQKKIDVVKQNKDLLANAKLILRTPEFDVDPEFYINPQDAAKIKQASGKKSTKVDITIAAPANEANVKFVYAMLAIMRHKFVNNPDAIPKDFKTVLDNYFKSDGVKIKGILWFLGGKSKSKEIAQPHKGPRKDWVIFGISQSQAKVKRRATAENTKASWMSKQLELTK
jgi:hypothetical protein